MDEKNKYRIKLAIVIGIAIMCVLIFGGRKLYLYKLSESLPTHFDNKENIINETIEESIKRQENDSSHTRETTAKENTEVTINEPVQDDNNLSNDLQELENVKEPVPIVEITPDTTSNIQYKIEFDGNGSTSGTMSSITCTYNKNCTLPSNKYTKTGYSFVGWGISKNSINYTDKSLVYNATNDDSITLYAIWNQNTSNQSTEQEAPYDIYFIGNGSTSGATNKITCKYTSPCQLPNNGFAKTGYSFDGWATSANGKVAYANKASVTGLAKSGVVNLYAHWKANTYTVTYNANGGTGTMQNSTATYDQDFITRKNAFKKEGYTFNGWNEKPDGSGIPWKLTSKGMFESNKYWKWTYARNVTLYAQWKANDVNRIHFMNVGTSDAIIIESNGKFGLVDASSPYRDGSNYSKDNDYESVERVKNYLKKLLGTRKLNFIIATHSHSDHIGGMPVIAANFVDANTKYYYRQYKNTADNQKDWEKIGELDWENDEYYNKALNAIKAKITNNSNIIEVTNQDREFTLGDMKINIMNTEEASPEEKQNGIQISENMNSLVTLITIGTQKVLLAGDMEISDESKIADRVQHVNVLKVGHHGSKTSSSISFLKKLYPNDVIISAKSFTVKDRAFTAMRFLQRKYNTDLYYTKISNSEAIVMTFNQDKNGYSFEKDYRTIQFNVEQHGGWEKLTYENSSTWAYFDGEGIAVTGINKLTYNGITANYYFRENGYMINDGWFKIKYNGADRWVYAYTDGRLAEKWKKIDNVWYYFKDNGIMAQNETLTLSGETFVFNASGACVQGRGC